VDISSVQIEPAIDKAIRDAIAAVRVTKLSYLGKERIVEPHDYGIQNGSVKLLAYQIGGESSGKLPNWRWLEVDRVSDIILLDRTFRGGRPAPSGNITNGTFCLRESNQALEYSNRASFIPSP
jgi:hypothetical protein